MENFYENLLKEIEKDARANNASGCVSGTKNMVERPETEGRVSGAEIWKAVLTRCEQIPESLRNAFVVQVLVSILHDQEVSIEILEKALREASDAVQRVEEAKRYRDAA